LESAGLVADLPAKEKSYGLFKAKAGLTNDWVIWAFGGEKPKMAHENIYTGLLGI
jgi:hypothetical protein